MTYRDEFYQRLLLQVKWYAELVDSLKGQENCPYLRFQFPKSLNRLILEMQIPGGPTGKLYCFILATTTGQYMLYISPTSTPPVSLRDRFYRTMSCPTAITNLLLVDR